MHTLMKSLFFFFNDTATTEIYTLSLHDALPISTLLAAAGLSLVFALVTSLSVLLSAGTGPQTGRAPTVDSLPDRKSTHLNNSHANISYSVFCFKKKKH